MFTRILATTALMLLPAAAMAGPSYSSDDIEAHFGQALECPAGQPCVPKAKTRAICIGTTSACSNQEVAAAPPKAFDMLITFELGSDRLSQQAQENLAEFAKALNGSTLSGAKFNIDGHTDARGSEGLNMGLSQRRAASVAKYLESLGVDPSRLQAKGYGESNPRVDDPFAAINRRVEAIIRTQ